MVKKLLRKIWFTLKHAYLKMLSVVIPMYTPMQGIDPLRHGSLGKLSMQIEELIANQDLLIDQVSKLNREVKKLREGAKHGAH